MNFFKLYIGDYQRDTAHLSIAEHGAYMLMLQHYYATEKPLPDGKALHRMLRAQTKVERDAIDFVAATFWTRTDGGFVNERADQEITKAGEQAETNARIAREREAKRRVSRSPQIQSTNTQRNEHDSCTNDQPNQTPDTRHHSQTPEREESNTHTDALSLTPDGVVCVGPTMASAVCVALRAQGLAGVNPSHPKLIALLAEGAPIDAFIQAARSPATLKSSRQFAYVLGTVEGQMQQAANIVKQATRSPVLSPAGQQTAANLAGAKALIFGVDRNEI